MAVQLRTKKLAGGKQSYYLDIWHGEKRYYEFLKLYTVKAKTPIDRDQNEKIRELANNIRAKREIELQSLDHGIVPKFKKNIDFLAYFQQFHDHYTNKDIRLVTGALKYFSLFLVDQQRKTILAKEINEQVCHDYKNFLVSKLHGETPYNYFKKFKQVIKQAYREKIIDEYYALGLTPVTDDRLKKEILTFDEIKKLAAANCGNDQVKRAFLFCLNTGLRWCDVKQLTWNNIKDGKLIFTQAKTRVKVESFLNKSALAMIGNPGKPDELVFHLPSHTACNKDLKTWVERAGIKKHITWHCARHSIAVNLLDKEGGNADVKTVAGVLGHKGLDMINTYLRAIDEKKKEALNRLPEINI